MARVCPCRYPRSRRPWKDPSNRDDGDCAVPGSNVKKQRRGALLPDCATTEVAVTEARTATTATVADDHTRTFRILIIVGLGLPPNAPDRLRREAPDRRMRILAHATAGDQERLALGQSIVEPLDLDEGAVLEQGDEPLDRKS